ncbi:hypothetical protein AB3M89_04130 [Microbacterium sp. 179-I 3D2 NHS]|uniref:hypothetical protein n=1 Tax=Microbacterium sp. 179-I 3D2 NHS TaxID=3235178 RepID=UPI0039A1E410
MDDKTPTPDQTPDHPTVPVTPTTDAAADAASAPAQPATPTASTAKPRRKRALLIGGGIAAAVVLVGGGVAVGAAIGDEFGDDDDRTSMSADHHDDDDRGSDRDDDGGAPADGRGPATDIGTDSADQLIEIADAARDAAEGEVTSIDAKRDGTWEVQLTAEDGAETDVRVDEQGAATVIASEAAEADDTAPTLTLSDEAIRSLVDAALTEADGRITDLDVDSDDVSPYDASVLTSDNRSIDISFTAEFAVIGSGTDD